MALICGHVWKPSAVHGDLFMVMDRPLRNGNNECEWEKEKKSVT